MAILPYTEIVLAFLFIVPLLFLWWWNRNPYAINWPVVGMSPRLLANSSRVLDLATDVLQQSGGTFVFKGPWFCGLDFLLTSDPTNLAYILSKNFDNYHRGPDFRAIFDVMGDGIITSEGESWGYQRKIIHSFLKHGKFEVVFQRIVQEKLSKAMFSVLDHFSIQGTEVDLQDVVHRLTYHLSCKLVLGFDPSSLSIEFPQDPVEAVSHEIEVAIFNRYNVPGFIWKLQRWLQIGTEKKMRENMETLDRFLYECIGRKREELTKKTAKSSRMEETEEPDFLTYILLEQETEDDDQEQSVFRKSDKFLRDVMISLLSAQSDTTSSALVWTLCMVATHPIVEAKILREMKSTQLQSSGDDDDDGVLSFQDLNKLVYLQATINEAIRLYPSIPIETKVSIGEDILPSGHQIGKNTRILYSIYSIGRMKEIWGEDCLEFKPERWICEKGKIKPVSPYKLLAFSAGPRSCLGKYLATMLMKALVSALIWNYCIRVVENHPVTPSHSIQLSMKYGLKVRVSKRWNMS